VHDGEDYIVVVANGVATLTLPAADTASIVSAGDYTLSGWAVLGGEEHTFYKAPLEILANPRTTVYGESRSQADNDLAAIEAVLSGRITSDMESYSIEGIAVTRIPIDRLLALRSNLRVQVWRERNPAATGIEHEAVFSAPR
jgi:hypothetical protein